MTSYSADIQRQYELKNDYFSQLKGLNTRFNPLLSELRAAKSRKQRAWEAFSKRLEALKAEWKEKSCDKCGATFSYHKDWSRVPSLCKDCRAKVKEEWKKQSCTKCGATFSYHQDWTRVPNLCKDCREIEKTKWHDKICERCGAKIRYHEGWQFIPKLCKACKGK